MLEASQASLGSLSVLRRRRLRRRQLLSEDGLKENSRARGFGPWNSPNFCFSDAKLVLTLMRLVLSMLP